MKRDPLQTALWRVQQAADTVAQNATSDTLSRLEVALRAYRQIERETLDAAKTYEGGFAAHANLRG